MNLVLKTAGLSALLLVAAAFTMPSGSAFAKDIVLGASVQLAGPVANTGRYYRDAYQLVIDKINAAGGVKVGSESHKLTLKLYDNQSDVNLSVRQCTQLVSQDNVNFLLEPFASNFALADSAVSEKCKIPMVEMLKGLDPAPKPIALLYADDAFDVSVAEGTRPKLKQAGLALDMDERYSTSATDFNSLLSQIRSKSIDAVLVAGHEAEILNFVRQAKSLAVAPKMYSLNARDLLPLTPDRAFAAGLVQVPEGRQLFDRMSVQDDLLMGAFIRDDKIAVVRDLDKIYTLFPRLAERRRQLAGSLSGGEQQMCAMARGLMAAPILLMIDEMSSGLAPVVVE